MPLIDISPRIDSASPVYPGDVPLRIRTICEEPALVTAFEMTPHLGAHVDAPRHMGGRGDVSELPLDLFVGECLVVDCVGVDVIRPEHIPNEVPERVLLKTGFVMGESWPSSYPYVSKAAVEKMAALGVRLVGIDSPSIDPQDDKLLSHHLAIASDMVILENLRLNDVSVGAYRLIALPLAIAGLEASPVRAILEK
ncbi:MAG: cyclase family protein [Burkholderiaceae bacterium]|nr:cyclase family protein [Burkholderiaceae bacterium]